MKGYGKAIRARIVENKLKSGFFQESVSVGLSEGAEIVILGQTPFLDYTIVQVHKKIFALPTAMIEKLEIRS